ncbi:hypothetical protein L1049_024263 [Liquidambar formosana]|uniref:Uncharacterized protein n=1 Tax=Liquidambar formosana TaxID=63359 RepID=A0AAP0RU61_LIQFO
MPFPPDTSTLALVACECIGFRFQCGLWNGKAQDCIGSSLIGFGNGWCRKDKRIVTGWQQPTLGCKKYKGSVMSIMTFIPHSNISKG